MTKNPILDELHATRRKLLEASGGTLEDLVAKLRINQGKSGRVILPTLRTNGSSAAGKSTDSSVDSRLQSLGED